MLRLVSSAVALMLASVGAMGACLNPFGCKPQNLAECRTDASKRPTERGVTVALRDCQEEFVDAPARAARAKVEAAQKKAWALTEQGGMTSRRVAQAMGRPADEVSKPGQCTEFPDRKPSGLCVFQRWEFGVAAPTGATGTDSLESYLQMEVSTTSGEIWAAWRTPSMGLALPWR